MKPPTQPFALCIDNEDYEVSLIPGKVYRILPDARAAKDDLVRIVDESGEDYLYHKSHFVFVDFPPAVRKKILQLEVASLDSSLLSEPVLADWNRPGEDKAWSHLQQRAGKRQR